MDLPEFVVPATSRCGIFSRFTTTGQPVMSRPSATFSGEGLRVNSGLSSSGLNEGTFGVARMGWIADYNDPVTYLELMMTGNS